MNKIFTISVITAAILLFILSGCSNETQTTAGTQPNETITPTTTTPTTTTTTETPLNIEIELELTGNETYSLVAVSNLDANMIPTGIAISGYIYQLKNAIANVDMTAEFYDSSETLIGTSELQFRLMGAWAIVGRDFTINFITDNLSQTKKCKLVVYAYE